MTVIKDRWQTHRPLGVMFQVRGEHVHVCMVIKIRGLFLYLLKIPRRENVHGNKKTTGMSLYLLKIHTEENVYGYHKTTDLLLSLHCRFQLRGGHGYHKLTDLFLYVSRFP